MTQTAAEQIAGWVWDLLASPDGDQLRCEGASLMAANRCIGEIDQGILRFYIARQSPAVQYYRAMGGAHFHDRSTIPFAMTALDTPVYHEYFREFLPDSRDALVVDVGGGDGRHALALLQKGFKRVVVIDAVAAALSRFRARILAESPQWLDRLVLIEGDVREMPLTSGSVDWVMAIESLYYLNEEYERGLAECYRVMRPRTRLLLAERSYEGALLTRLLYYGGVKAMLDTVETQEMWDGEGHLRVRTRCFTREELEALIATQGFKIIKWGGISAFSLLLSFLSKLDKLGSHSEAQMAGVHRLLVRLSQSGCWNRCHVIVVAKTAAAG
jgi:ubiquinone/menaquinone biosynthesis C-methylase UbiE